ncbi:MAG: hypothetical protein Q7S52_06005 [bacterium]|nr:hypothetical protein [bacterium]
MTPLVVGICHAANYSFLSAYSQERFVREICPIINDNSLLVLEGAYRRTIFHPEHKKYPKERRAAERHLGVKLPGLPSIAWRDPRMFPLHRGILFRELEDRLERILDSIPQPGLSCRSLAELLRRIEDGLPPYISKRGLSYAQKKALWHNAKEMRESDRRLIATAKKYKDAHQVILVCGLAHALAIANSEGWILKPFIEDTPAEMSLTIRVYHTTYVLPAYFPLPRR